MAVQRRHHSIGCLQIGVEEEVAAFDLPTQHHLAVLLNSSVRIADIDEGCLRGISRAQRDARFGYMDVAPLGHTPDKPILQPLPHHRTLHDQHPLPHLYWTLTLL